MTPTLNLLGKRRFLPLFITQFLNAFNDNVAVLVAFYAICHLVVAVLVLFFMPAHKVESKPNVKDLIGGIGKVITDALRAAGLMK